MLVNNINDKIFVKVEHCDTDASGVIHFARYASLMETAVLEQLARNGAALTSWQQLGYDLVISHIDIRYFVAGKFADELIIETDLTHKGPASLQFEVKVLRRQDDESITCLSKGLLHFACINKANGKSTLIPPSLNQVLKVTKNAE